jgi:hypothetical protein
MRVDLALSVVAMTGVFIWSPSAVTLHGGTKAPTNGALDRSAAIARARVWERTDIPAMDLMAGPTEGKSFAFDETVTCAWVDRKLSGKTPKFACTMDGDELKVKMGGNNGEVYAEVAATRLLWALGFGADHMYSVKVVCHGCPKKLNGVIGENDDSIFDPAAVERKLSGVSYHPEGWSWKELDQVDERAGGATRAERDALKLLAVFIQHSDSKAEQQRLICRGESKEEQQDASHKTLRCDHPLMYLNDVGVTLGRANRLNNGDIGSMNLTAWSSTPVWKDKAGCVGNLPKSLTGTLDNPVISEGGRQFLADLLTQLSDAQLHDMFAAARVQLRLRDPKDVFSGFATVDEWVGAFKTKRDQIINAHCSTS